MIILDLEANGLLPDATRIWVGSISNGSKITSFRDHRKIIEKIDEADLIITHNGCGYDIPLLEKLYGIDGSRIIDKVFDTEVVSRLLNPDREGGHSLEAWGQRLGIEKIPDLDWSRWNEGMIERCETDVRITERLYHHLISEMKNCDWTQSIWIEKWISYYHAHQVINGINFDKQFALETLGKIRQELDSIDKKLLKELPKRIIQDSTVLEPFKKNGEVKERAKEWNPSGPFTKIIIEDMNLNSHVQIKDYLLSQGWEPIEYTEKGSPKLTEESYATIKGDLGQQLARRSILTHRASLIDGLVGRIRSDGHVTADAITNGTNTGRYQHINVVNIPKAKDHIVYGKECRQMFIASGDRILVGTDAAALEARMEAHYTYRYDGGKYAKELLEGDIHTRNAEIFHVNRDLAKNGKYALTYGCLPTKLAKTIGKTFKEAKKYYTDFWNHNKALAALKRDIESVLSSRNYLVSLDGRRIYIRSKHSALNALFQSAGSIAVKYATVLMNKRFIEEGIDYRQVIHNHDEVVFDVAKKDVDKVVEMLYTIWVEVGKHFKLNVPLEGDVKVGHSWAEVH